MVIITVAKELIKFGIRSSRKYYALESKAFSKLYTGFPRSRTIGRGVRHGLVAGSIGGSFINDAEDTPGNGVQKPLQPKQSAPRQSYKTRSRQTSRCRPGNSRYYKFNQRSRRSSYR